MSVSTFCGGGSCVDVAESDDVVMVWNTETPGESVKFTVREWRAFVLGVKDGQFDF